MLGTAITILVILYSVCGTEEVEISNCSSNKLVVFEDSSEAIVCQNIPRNSGNVWLRLKDGGTEQVLGDCSSEGICSRNSKDRVNIRHITRNNQSTDSRLILKRFQDLANDQIICEDTLQKTRHTCRLVIRHHPVFSNCFVSVTKVNRAVFGSCFVSSMFSSDKIYECVWTIIQMNNNNTVNRKAGDFGNTLHRDETSCKGSECYQGTCSFEWQLPQQNENYIFKVTAIGSTKTAFAQVISNGNHQLGNCSTIENTTTSSTNGWRWTWQEGYIAGIAFASVIIVGIIVAVTVVCIKRIGGIYDQTTRKNFNEHPLYEWTCQPKTN